MSSLREQKSRYYEELKPLTPLQEKLDILGACIWGAVIGYLLLEIFFPIGGM